MARIFSAIIGVAGIYAMYLLGKEIKDEKVGLIAAALLTLNYFHISHSQEVRMYGLLTLFTILSFYGLVRFLKESNLKRAIVYGFFTGLMLLTQFFGLFVLAAQLFILLVFFIKTEKTGRMNFFYKSLISGGIMIVLFMPALNIFIATTKRKYAAMKPVTIDGIEQIFKDFVRESNYLLILALIAIAFYLFVVIKNRAVKKENNTTELQNSKVTFILLSWILITLMIPIVRSYLVTPMIVSRYFIVILPAILVLIALGIASMKNKIVSYGFLALFLGTSFYVLVCQPTITI